MKYKHTLFLIPVLIILLIACNPKHVEQTQGVLVSPTSAATIEITVTAHPLPTQSASAAPTATEKRNSYISGQT